MFYTCPACCLLGQFFLVSLQVQTFMGKDTRKSGLSNAVQVRYGGGYRHAPKDETICINKTTKQLKNEQQKQRDYVAGMTSPFLTYFSD